MLSVIWHENEESPRVKSKVSCYNFEKREHFAYECCRRKEEKLKFLRFGRSIHSHLSWKLERILKLVTPRIQWVGSNEGMWYLDNRASDHMIGECHLFQELNEFNLEW